MAWIQDFKMRKAEFQLSRCYWEFMLESVHAWIRHANHNFCDMLALNKYLLNWWAFSDSSPTVKHQAPGTLFVLAILGSMSFYVSLGSAYQFLPNKQPGSWYGLCWLCRLTCRVLLYNNIKYSSPWTQDVFDFLQVFISFYQWCFVVSSAQVLFILLLSILVLLMLL